MSTVTIDTERLRWACDRCRRAVGDGAGYLHVSYDDINTTMSKRRAWERKWAPDPDSLDPGGIHGIPGTALDELPEAIHWRVHHLRCDPNPDGTDYAIRVEEVRGHAQLLGWTAHLMGKTWIGQTDWDDIIRKAADCDA